MIQTTRKAGAGVFFLARLYHWSMITAADGGSETFERLTKQLARGGGVYTFSSIISKIVHFALQILLGRVLGTGGYGLYALGLSITGITKSISSLGLENGVVRFVSLYRGKGDKARIKGTLISSLTISLVFSTIIAGLLFVFSRFISSRIFNEPNLISVFRIFSISLPFYVLMTITSFSARGFVKTEYEAGLTGIFHPVTNLLFVGFAFLLGFRLSGAIYGFLASCVLSAIFGLYLLWKVFPETLGALRSKNETGKLLLFSLPVLLSSIATLFLFQIDRLMLGWLGTSSDVGVYNAAATISVQTGLLIQALSRISSPIISDLHNREKGKELKHVFRTTTRWGFMSTLPLFLVFMIFPNDLLALFGPDYREGALALVILSSASFIQAIRGPTVPLLIMSGKQNVELLNTIVLMSINVVLNVWLIRLLGLLGAAIATAISTSLLSIVRLLEVKFLLRMQPYDRKYTKPLLAGVVAVAVGLFARSTLRDGFMWIVSATIIILVYIGVLCVLGLEKEELLVIRAIKRRIFQN